MSAWGAWGGCFSARQWRLSSGAGWLDPWGGAHPAPMRAPPGALIPLPAPLHTHTHPSTQRQAQAGQAAAPRQGPSEEGVWQAVWEEKVMWRVARPFVTTASFLAPPAPPAGCTPRECGACMSVMCVRQPSCAHHHRAPLLAPLWAPRARANYLLRASVAGRQVAGLPERQPIGVSQTSVWGSEG